MSSAGIGADALRAALRRGRPALQAWHDARSQRSMWVGAVPGVEAAPLPASWVALDARATRLAWQALHADGFAQHAADAIARFGAARVGLAVGTSASTIDCTEQVYARESRGEAVPDALRAPQRHHMHAVAAFVAQALGIAGPQATVSTACSSSARALGVASRWLRWGLADAVVVGGVDALCDHVLHGFASLQLTSAQPCRPFDVARDGISPGEAAVFVLLERADRAAVGRAAAAPRLLAVGESSDAHHMSAPDPTGAGPLEALDAALAAARIAPGAVDYLNLHGTATPKNDAMEAALLRARFGDALHASSTKGLTGHTMGAAGLLETWIALDAIATGWRPGTIGCTERDAQVPASVRLCGAAGPVRVAASTSFGFGGTNAVVVVAAPGASA